MHGCLSHNNLRVVPPLRNGEKDTKKFQRSKGIKKIRNIKELRNRLEIITHIVLPFHQTMIWLATKQFHILNTKELRIEATMNLYGYALPINFTLFFVGMYLRILLWLNELSSRYLKVIVDTCKKV